jgi:hypothetical protein
MAVLESTRKPTKQFDMKAFSTRNPVEPPPSDIQKPQPQLVDLPIRLDQAPPIVVIDYFSALDCSDAINSNDVLHIVVTRHSGNKKTQKHRHEEDSESAKKIANLFYLNHAIPRARIRELPEAKSSDVVSEMQALLDQSKTGMY